MAFTCSKSTMETQEQCVKPAQKTLKKRDINEAEDFNSKVFIKEYFRADISKPFGKNPFRSNLL